jgi:agmatine/peptidylarginine deiminase
MIDSKGNCYIAQLGFEGDLKEMGCLKIHLLPELPGEGTGHIDIFAKLLNDSSVLVSRYKTNSIALLKEKKKSRLICSEDNVAQENWESCEFKDQTLPSPDSILLKSNGEIRVFDQLQIAEQLGVTSDGHSWVEHSNDTASFFKKLGVEVIEVGAPAPVAYLHEMAFEDSSGKQVHKTNELEFRFPTFTNSLIINNNVVIPNYGKLASKQLNDDAVEKYNLYFHKVLSLPSDSNILLGGSIHCLTMDVH